MQRRLAQALEVQADGLEEVADARRKWWVETEDLRSDTAAANAELTRREATLSESVDRRLSPAGSERSSEWLVAPEREETEANEERDLYRGWSVDQAAERDVDDRGWALDDSFGLQR